MDEITITPGMLFESRSRDTRYCPYKAYGRNPDAPAGFVTSVLVWNANSLRFEISNLDARFTLTHFREQIACGNWREV